MFGLAAFADGNDHSVVIAKSGNGVGVAGVAVFVFAGVGEVEFAGDDNVVAG